MRACIINVSSLKLKNLISNQDRIALKHIGRGPHLGLSTIASALLQENHTVKFIDIASEEIILSEILSKIKAFHPDVLLFSATTPNFHTVLEWIKQIKKHIDLPVIVGGHHFTHYPRESLTYKEIDYIVIGDGFITIKELLNCIEKNRNLSKIKGIGFKQNKKIILTQPRPEITSMDDLPFPARNLLKNSKYFNFLTRRKNYTTMLTERGCPGKCIFCDIGRMKYCYRSPEKVIEEIKECYDNYKIREIQFYDASFTTNKKRAMEICRKIIKEKLDIEWSVSAKVNFVNKELLTLMKKAGCRRLQYGIETGNPNIMKVIKKHTDLKIMTRAINITKELGLTVLGFLMLGLPTETHKTMENTVKFALKSKIDYVTFSLTRSFPNTEMYEKQIKELGYDYYKKYTLNKLRKNEILPLYGTSLTVKEVQEKIKEAYKRFYYRPKQIARIIKDIRSPLQFKRYISAGFDMFLDVLFR